MCAGIGNRAVHEPSDTTPNPNSNTEEATCENCGASLTPMEWTTLDDDEEVNDVESTGYEAVLYFCDQECITEWKTSR